MDGPVPIEEYTVRLRKKPIDGSATSQLRKLWEKVGFVLMKLTGNGPMNGSERGHRQIEMRAVAVVREAATLLRVAGVGLSFGVMP